MKKIRKAIIPVAGNGTRFLPFTKTIPKEMLPIINKPTIDYIVDEAIESGIEEIIFITSSTKTAIVDYYDRHHQLEYELKKKGKENLITEIADPANKAKFFWIRQHEAKGLGHAVSLAAPLIGKDESFALLLGDDVIYHEKNECKNPVCDTKEGNCPSLMKLIDVHEKTGLSVLGVQEVPESKVSSYGVIEPSEEISEDTWKVSSVIEKPKQEDAPSNLAIVGRYVLHQKIFDYLAENNVDEATNEIQITDSILKLGNELGVAAVKIDGNRYDMGSIQGFLKAQIEFALRSPEYKEDLIKVIKDLKLEE